MPDKKEGFGEVAYVLGIISIVLAFVSPLAGLVIGIIGFNYGKKDKTPLSAKGKKLSKIGIIFSIIMLIIYIAIAVYTGLSSLNSLNLPGA